MMLTNNVTLHYLLIGATGTFYAVINALPIALINEYHEDQQLYFGPKRNFSSANSNNNNSNNNNNLDSVPQISDYSSDDDFQQLHPHPHHRRPPPRGLAPEVVVPMALHFEKRGIGTDM